MKPISDRYEQNEFISTLFGGRLYAGKDVSLQRPVFLYEVPVRGEQQAAAYVRSLRDASQADGLSPFLPIMDVEFDAETVRVVLHAKPGAPLLQCIRRRALPLREAAAIVGDFGRSLLAAAEERPLRFSLAADNIWVTDDNRLLVIDSWSVREPQERPALQLGRHLYRLAAGSESAPGDAETAIAHLWRHMQTWSPAQKDAVVSAIAGAWNEQSTLVSFVQQLSSLSGQTAKPFAPGGKPLHPEFHTEPHVQFPPERVDYEANGEAQREADDEAPMARERAAGWRRISRFGKRLSIGVTLSAIGIAVFVGVLALLIGSLGPKDKPAAMPPADAESSQADEPVKERPTSSSAGNEQAPDNSGNRTEKSAPPANPNPPADPDPPANPDSADTVTMPSLIGLTREEAEKRTLAAGLHYQFFLEPNERTAGTVFKQEPEPDSQVSKSVRITFWVSKGPPASR